MTATRARVTEAARERETFRYEPNLRLNSTPNDTGDHLPNSELRSCEDAVLTCFAQLVACRTNSSRVFISLFDQNREYIIAEATATLPLSPGLGYTQRGGEGGHELLLCGTSIPKTEGICCRVLDAEGVEDEHGNTTLPVIVIPDIRSDTGLASKPYCTSGRMGRAYAGVPIRTRNGVNIGVLSLFKDEPIPASSWDVLHSQILRDVSSCIVGHLRSKRERIASHRAQRMARAIGSFVENRSTLPYWEFGGTVEYPEEETGEGTLNAQQQAKERDVDSPLDEKQLFHNGLYADNLGHTPGQFPDNVGSNQDGLISRQAETGNSTVSVQASEVHTPKSDTAASSEEINTVEEIFSRAANIIREAIETEGIVFLDAVPKSFGSLTKKSESREKEPPPSPIRLDTSSSDDTRSDSTVKSAAGSHADILGFSTSNFSSINRDKPSPHNPKLSAKLLKAIVQKYPTGAILNFDEDGAIQANEPSTDDQVSTPTEQYENSTSRRLGAPSYARQSSIHKETPEEVLPKVFPGARSVAFVPVWDQKKERCIAGGFAYTRTPTRVLTRSGELSYFRAFAMIIMSEIHRLETSLSNQSQSDVLSSLSHEMRSPLHGMVLGVELLMDTSLNAFQGNVLHTMETCGRTLADTIDHLLYFSKINNYVGPDKRPDQGARGLRLGAWPSLEAGMKSIYMNVQLDSLVEEVVESVFAGFNFFMLSVGQIRRDGQAAQDVEAVRRNDRRQAMEEVEHTKRAVEAIPDDLPTGHARPLLVDLDIDPGVPHFFRTIPGGVRRIIMNLLGNALKYTTSGSIRVSLSQEWGRTKRMRCSAQLVKLTVSDTGRGISKEYLRENLYQAFAQEDRLAPGLGLGLNVVKKVATSLNGRVSVDSEVGLGTTVTVLLPLQSVNASDSTSMTNEEEGELVFFENQRRELKGLRICLVGFDKPVRLPLRHRGSSEVKSSPQSVWKICRNWLQMEVVSTTEATSLAPDLILCEDSATSHAYMSNPESLKAPVVVVCADVPTAFRRSSDIDSQSGSRAMDFVSQPLGPRKLANILLAGVKRWVEHQDTLTPPRPVSSLTLDLPPSRHNLGSRRSPSGSPNRAKANSRGTRRYQGISENGRPSSMNGEKTWPACPRSEGHPKEVPSSNSSGPGEVESPKFLLVDDNPINLRILSAYMRKLNLSFALANDGQEAVDKVCQLPGQYACIFMDINMPRLDGLEATRRIRNFEQSNGHAQSTIIALSGLASSSVQEEAFQSGIELFLTKPVKLKEISEILTARGLLR